MRESLSPKCQRQKIPDGIYTVLLIGLPVQHVTALSSDRPRPHVTDGTRPDQGRRPPERR